MNKRWRVSKPFLTRRLVRFELNFNSLIYAILTVLCVLQMGCYSGWNHDKSGDDKRVPTPTGDGTRPFAFLLLEVVRPSSVPGQHRCGNGDSSTLVTFRQNEWRERTDALVKALTPLADQFVKNEVEIDGDDCDTMQALELRASTRTYGTLLPSTPDPNGRPIIHLKLILWDGYAPYLNSWQLPAVFQKDWADWQYLSNNGFSNLYSLHEFVLSNSWGVFANWRDLLDENVRMNGLTIDTVDPTDQATQARHELIVRDALQLVSWLRATTLGYNSTTMPFTGGDAR